MRRRARHSCSPTMGYIWSDGRPSSEIRRAVNWQLGTPDSIPDGGQLPGRACPLSRGVMNIDDMRQPDSVFTKTPPHLTGTADGLSAGAPPVNSSGVMSTATPGDTSAIRSSFNCGSSLQIPSHDFSNASMASWYPQTELNELRIAEVSPGVAVLITPLL